LRRAAGYWPIILSWAVPAMIFALVSVVWSAAHVVFYRPEDEGMLVSRILHQRMLPGGHAIDDEDHG
jgi:hypothetical protein